MIISTITHLYWQLSSIFHELWDLWYDSLNAQSREKINYIRIKDTGRTTNIPPLVAPYNFGINKGWMRDESVNFSRLVTDWGRFPDPDGFGEFAAEKETEEDTGDDADEE